MTLNQNDPQINFTQKQIKEAYLIWKQSIPTQAFDQKIDSFFERPPLSPLQKAIDEMLTSEQEKEKLHNYGNLRLAREALFLSSNTMASKLGISRRGYSFLEQSEQKEAISIGKLRQMAEAMDCELVYFIRPKSGVSYSQELWKKVLPLALAKLAPQRQIAEHLKAKRLASTAKLIFEKTEFREKHGLTQRGKDPGFKEFKPSGPRACPFLE